MKACWFHPYKLQILLTRIWTHFDVWSPNLYFDLKGLGSHTRLLFLDFCSAFDRAKTQISTARLFDPFCLSIYKVGWISVVLPNHIKRLGVNGALSDQWWSSTGCPQGWVVSLTRCSLYKYEPWQMWPYTAYSIKVIYLSSIHFLLWCSTKFCLQSSFHDLLSAWQHLPKT